LAHQICFVAGMLSAQRFAAQPPRFSTVGCSGGLGRLATAVTSRLSFGK
jgi:hypothetical protein